VPVRSFSSAAVTAQIARAGHDQHGVEREDPHLHVTALP
jgi:hypothetical protein